MESLEDKMTVKEVNICEYKTLLTELYKEDDDLLNKYHISSGKGLEYCVDKTVRDFLSFSSYKLYKILVDNQVVAFFGKEYVDGIWFMTGFFIKINYRTKNFVYLFWKNVKKTFSQKHIYCNIYKKNTRAQKFLEKNGKLVYQTEEVLTFKLF